MNKLNEMYDVPAGFILRVTHLHPGNSSRKQRHGHAYRTIARLCSEDNAACFTATAECSAHDTPSRKRGRDIAVARVLKKFSSYPVGK